jgi:hypothetical protein
MKKILTLLEAIERNSEALAIADPEGSKLVPLDICYFAILFYLIKLKFNLDDD